MMDMVMIICLALFLEFLVLQTMMSERMIGVLLWLYNRSCRIPDDTIIFAIACCYYYMCFVLLVATSCIPPDQV